MVSIFFSAWCGYDEVILGWYLSETTTNNWRNDTIRLEIQICSIALNESNGGIIKNTCIVLQTNLIPQLGFQSTSVTIPSISNNSLPTVFFRIIARDILTNITYAGLNSALIVLHDSRINTTDYCNTWASTQASPLTWNDNLLPCPLTLSQARVARCCYEPDPLCMENSYNSSINCRLHRGRPDHDELSAIACYLSRSTNQWHAATECCYDAIGQLITRGTGGGTDDRYQPSSYPILHFFSDTLPFLACCLLTSNDETCSRYFNFRPHRRGSNSPHSWGGTWGDPHFTTLDGSTYTFNGYGEYTYLAITNSSTSNNTAFNSSIENFVFNVQIRATPFDSLNNGATVIRGIAAKSNDFLAQNMSITISRREMLIIRRGNETLDLDSINDDTISTNNSLILFFPEMTLERNRTNGILILSWFIGVSIRITPILITNALVLNIDISVSGLYQNRTFGLLGLYDNDPTNDLRAQNGTIIGLSNTLTIEQIHRQFGQTWAINPNDSLFHYETGDSAANYAQQNLLYIPLFTYPEPSVSQVNSILAACNIESSSSNRSIWTIAQQTCYYDIAVTNNTSLGQASAIAADNIIQVSIDQRNPPEFNLDLPLIIIINESTPMIINFTAVSQYTSNIVYNLIRGPFSATFDNETAIFYWQNPSLNDSNTAIRVTARDTLYNLLSTHELVVHIVGRNIDETTTSTSSTTSTTTTTTSTTSSSRESSDGYVILVSSIFVLMNIIEIFYYC
ncbi:unnamed protein product [Rotaria sp. Silwood2]|nr:unnamed protein product [Rotaria sp. Silwood2]